MSLSRLVDDLIGMVEQGRFLEAFERFYASDAEVRENDQPARVGLEALIANETAVLSAFRSVRGKALTSLVDDEQAVIRWAFEFAASDGGLIRLDELTLQTWRGDKITHEKFYYDPAQMRPLRQTAVDAASAR